jgi:flagellar motility protein MotE (MotC chaperone)
MLNISVPRLLPSTIAVLAMLLLLKCGILLQGVLTHGPKPDSGMVAAATAATTEQIQEPVKPPPAGKGSPAAAPPPTSAPAPASAGPPPVSESEKALLLELRRRRMDLDTRAEEIKAHESVMTATEEKLSARVNELQSLQKKLQGLDVAQKQKEDAGWQGLVKLYETMKPKEAATIFNDLSMPVLLQLLDRMKEAKAASIMAAMNPEKARDVTSELAQMRTGRDASGAPVAGVKNNLIGG